MPANIEKTKTYTLSPYQNTLKTVGSDIFKSTTTAQIIEELKRTNNTEDLKNKNNS